jgi:transcription-repair coupling factor (superfamily II helicase)
MAQIDEMERELADRFGPLGEPTRNLMYQLRVKALARDAGVRSIGVQDGTLVLRSGRGDFAERERLQRALDERAVVSRRKIRMPMKRGWQEELVDVLERIARTIG